MRILVACEYSGRVREAFKAKGHEAWSVDLEPTDIPGSHLQQDVLELLDDGWDMMIAFPPCTDLAVSGARYFAAKRADGRHDPNRIFDTNPRNRGICKSHEKFNRLLLSSIWRKPDQIIQPWQFGEPESKQTCLWLKNLPLLVHTKVLEKPESGYWNNQTPSGQNKLGPGPKRAKLRSLTYQGVADAMADQWGRLESEE